MTANERWNKIVQLHNDTRNKPEADIQVLWEQIFTDFFGYKRLLGEVDNHRQIQIGSSERVITDIIIKSGEADLFVVELKRHNAAFDSSMERQLISYLKQLQLNIGVLICDKIYIYNFVFGKPDNEQDKAKIDFTPDNPDGVRFVKMFVKDSFCQLYIQGFINEKIKAIENATMMRRELTAELVAKLLKAHFTESYGEEAAIELVEDFDILIVPKIILETEPELAQTNITPQARPEEMSEGVKFTAETMEIIYSFAQKVHSGNLTSTEASREISSKTGMNTASAKAYIRAFQAMMQGIEYKRAINERSTRFLVSQIRADYGEEAYRNAIDALYKHAKYYASFGQGNLRYVERIVDEANAGQEH